MLTVGAGMRRFAFTEGPVSAPDVERLGERDFTDRPGTLSRATALAGDVPFWAQDLERIARAVFLVDKRFLRKDMDDRWTRTIDLDVQLIEPDRWDAGPRRQLEALLGMLTGDLWTIRVHGGAAGTQHEFDLMERPAAAVALLSGGLDSACHAAVAAGAGPLPLHLIAYDASAQRAQLRVVDAVRRAAGRSDAEVVLRQVAQRPAAAAPGQALEQSSRSRGFLYAVTAVLVAATHQLAVANVPENGQLAVNPALTPARLGPLSTRSVHPWTVERLNALVAAIGGGVEVVNPLLGLTKGEVCSAGLEAGLAPADLFRTTSCGNPRAAAAVPGRNCGYCFPCLVRRSGLHHATADDRTPYHDPVGTGEGSPSDRHLRAVRRWLAGGFGEESLVADMPWPPSTPPASVLPVLLRGRTELRAWVRTLR